MKDLRHSNLLILSSVLLLALPGPVLSQVTQYQCSFEQERKRGGGWVPETLVLSHNDQTGEVIVFDPVIQYFVGVPIAAVATNSSAARKSFRWEVDTQNRGQSARLIYDFSYFTNGRPAKVRVLPGGYDNSWTGEGSCTVTVG